MVRMGVVGILYGLQGKSLCGQFHDRAVARFRAGNGQSVAHQGSATDDLAVQGKGGRGTGRKIEFGHPVRTQRIKPLGVRGSGRSVLHL